MNEQAFVRLARRVFEGFLWKEERAFSRFEAWLDLIKTAAFAPKSELVQGRCLNLQVGELVASVRYLAARWDWPKSKVERYLDILRDQKMIGTRTETGIGIVRLCNYARYNTKEEAAGTPERTPARQSRDEGKKERIEEGRGEALAETPNLKEFQRICRTHLIPDWYSEEKFVLWDAKQWAHKGTPYAWKKTVPMVARDYVNDGRPTRNAPDLKNAKPIDPIGWPEFLIRKQLDYVPHERALETWKKAFTEQLPK